MKATITDVAERAGVSMKTVSRVLNNEPNVAEKTREHVKAVAAELRYSPNLAARGLATSKSYLIALMYDDPSPNYIAHIQRGAIDACREVDYHLVVQPLSLGANKTQDEQEQAIRSVLDRLPVDGVILTPPLCDSKIILETLAELKIKCVRIAPQNGGDQPFIAMDDETAAYQMTQYLIEQGHKRLGFIKGNLTHSATASRYNGFMKAMREAGLEMPSECIAQGDFSFASGVTAAQSLLALDEEMRPTAIFASNDDMATGVFSVAGQMGIDVPTELSVCGFDDTPLAQVVFPPLTTVRQPIYKMGYEAARQAIKKADDAVDTEQILDFDIMIRGSVSALNS